MDSSLNGYAPVLVTSRKHAAVTEFSAAADKPSADAFIVEGVHFTDDLPAGCVIAAFFTEGFETETAVRLSSAGARVYIAPSSVMEKLSGTVNPQSALALVRKPPLPRPSRLLLLDGIQDPGNMGTVIRTAAAFGFGVVTGEGCASPFRQKVVRSSAGALMKTYTEEAPDLPEYIKRLRADSFTVLSAELDPKAASSDKISPVPPLALVIGNESRGVSPAVSAAAQGKVYIPIARENAESLNAAVAASILMYICR